MASETEKELVREVRGGMLNIAEQQNRERARERARWSRIEDQGARLDGGHALIITRGSGEIICTSTYEIKKISSKIRIKKHKSRHRCVKNIRDRKKSQSKKEKREKEGKKETKTKTRAEEGKSRGRVRRELTSSGK